MTLSIVVMHEVKNQSSNLLAHYISTKLTSTVILHFVYCLIAYLRFCASDFFCYKNKMTFLPSCHKIQLKPIQIFWSFYKTYHTHEKKKENCLKIMQILGLFENGKKTFSLRSTEMAARTNVAQLFEFFNSVQVSVTAVGFFSCSRLHVFTD